MELAKPGNNIISKYIIETFQDNTPLTIVTILLLTAAGSTAQDVHFAQVQDMNTWYNPALKTNKVPLVHLNMRSVKYQKITAYSNKAATIELPLISKEKEAEDVIHRRRALEFSYMLNL